MLEKIISGGQTGVDQAALYAAESLGITTGGWMPKGFKTDAGNDAVLATIFGLQEHQSAEYPPRTEANVIAADATFIFGDADSPGCRLTRLLCHDHKKPAYVLGWTYGAKGAQFTDADVFAFRGWLDEIQPKTLNVAGNRERTNPGIFCACRDFLIAALAPARH